MAAVRSRRSQRPLWGPRAAVVAAVVLGSGCSPASPAGGPRTRPSPPPPEDLVRKGNRPVVVRSGDLDGDGGPEVAIASVSEVVDELEPAAPSLEVFGVRDGRWVRVFDAEAGAPPGSGAPPEMLAPADQGFVSQSVDTLELVDFAGDGRPELVAGILNFGATAGPLELWVVSMRAGGSFATELYQASARDGSVEVRRDRVRFTFGVYGKHDPGCCPSLLAVQTIGWNAASGRVEVLREDRSPAPGG